MYRVCITNNTFYTTQPNFHDNGGCTSEVVRNNYFVSGLPLRPDGSTFDYNVPSTGDSCGTHTKTCTATWAAGGSPTDANPNITHPTPASRTPEIQPTTHRPPNGVTRPQGSAPDASANEVG